MWPFSNCKVPPFSFIRHDPLSSCNMKLYFLGQWYTSWGCHSNMARFLQKEVYHGSTLIIIHLAYDTSCSWCSLERCGQCWHELERCSLKGGLHDDLAAHLLWVKCHSFYILRCKHDSQLMLPYKVLPKEILPTMFPTYSVSPVHKWAVTQQSMSSLWVLLMPYGNSF